jgi:hypothetical protein
VLLQSLAVGRFLANDNSLFAGNHPRRAKYITAEQCLRVAHALLTVACGYILKRGTVYSNHTLQ